MLLIYWFKHWERMAKAWRWCDDNIDFRWDTLVVRRCVNDVNFVTSEILGIFWKFLINVSHFRSIFFAHDLMKWNLFNGAWLTGVESKYFLCIAIICSHGSSSWMKHKQRCLLAAVRVLEVKEKEKKMEGSVHMKA